MKNRIFKNTTETILTDRLFLRQFTDADAPTMYQNWASDPEVTKYLTWPAHTDLRQTQEIVKIWVEGYQQSDFYQWAVVLKATEQPIGSIGLVKCIPELRQGEIGYCIGRQYWNQRYATEALTAVIDFLIKECGFVMLEAKHDTRNHNSGKVMQKSGMTFRQTQHNAGVSKEGEVISFDCYEIKDTSIFQP